AEDAAGQVQIHAIGIGFDIVDDHDGPAGGPDKPARQCSEQGLVIGDEPPATPADQARDLFEGPVAEPDPDRVPVIPLLHRVLDRHDWAYREALRAKATA